MRWCDKIEIGYAYKQGYFGENIGIAVLDSGIFPHNDFINKKNRIIAFADFVNNKPKMYDDSGHGTHVAGIAASNGLHKDKYYIGAAPRANIIAVKVLDRFGNGKVSNVIRGLNWVIKNKERYNIRIANISVGTAVTKAVDEKTELINAVNKVWDSGIFVVVAAGNNGPKRMTITSPGISRKVLTVGSSEENSQSNISGEIIKSYSGRGPTVACIVKPEIVAPGNNIISCANGNTGYIEKSGTSMSTPIVSGAIALLLEKEPNLTPKDVKMRLHDTAMDIGLPKNQQGWGMINVRQLFL